MMYKFRTMRVDAESDGRAVWATKSDPRTTSPVGIPTSNTFGQTAYADMGAFEFVETAISPVDLVVASIAGPQAVMADTFTTVTWTIANIGSGIAR